MLSAQSSVLTSVIVGSGILARAIFLAQSVSMSPEVGHESQRQQQKFAIAKGASRQHDDMVNAKTAIEGTLRGRSSTSHTAATKRLAVTWSWVVQGSWMRKLSIERTRSERVWVSECRTSSRLVAELQSRIVGVRAAWAHFHQLSLARGSASARCVSRQGRRQKGAAKQGPEGRREKNSSWVLTA